MQKRNFFNPIFPFSPKKSPIYYGYIIVLMAVIAAVITAPGQTMGFSVYIDYFIKAFHLSRVQLSAAYMIGTIGSSLIIRRAGALIDKYGSRLIGFYAAVLLGATLIVFSKVDIFTYPGFSLVVFLLTTLCFFGIRFLAQGVLSLVSRTMLMQWFMNLRGRMASITGVFTTLAMAAAPVVFNWLIMKFGWRNSYLIMGLVIGLFCAIIFWLFARSNPEECGLKPDGKQRSVADTDERIIAERNYTLSEAKATYRFWIFNLSLAMYSFLLTAFAFHVTSIFSLAGLSRHLALTVFFPSACISLAVKLISGWLCDVPVLKSKLNYQLALYLFAMLLFCLGILLLRTIWGRDLIIVGTGIATGLFVTVSAVCWPQFFGRKHLGSISGLNNAYRIFFSAIGPLFFAVSVKFTGGYATATSICLVFVILFMILALRMSL